MNILILRVSSIGDIVHTLPSIFLIKSTYPKAKISWLVQKKAASLIEKQPFLENVWVLPDKFLFPKNWGQTFKILKEIRKTKWDAIIDFQGIPKTSILSLFMKGTKYGFDFHNSRLWVTSLFTNLHTNPIYTNIIQKNLALTSDALQNLTAQKTNVCPTIDNLQKLFICNFPQESKNLVNDWVAEKKLANFIALIPNTTWDSKHWPQENWGKLIELLLKNPLITPKHSVVLIGKDFGNQAQKIADFIKDKRLSVHLAPGWNLITTTYLISKASLIIAPDTGLLHIADFLGKKTIGIFGPTNAKKHGPFLTIENIKYAIQIECPHKYQKNHGNLKQNSQKASIGANCMYKLSSECLFDKILKTLS
jgi:lipopolysaccharide heptosyltransferase I